MSETICAVVVTYNRKNLLRVCLNTVLAQSRPPDQIIIVDNVSTDGTLDMVAAEFPQLPVLKLERNSGGAGGFEAGMKWAYEKGYDWIWVMDDDARALPGTLEKMLSYGGIADFVQSRKRESGSLLVWEALWDPHACYPTNFVRDASFANGKEWTAISYANFEGALIRRMVVEKIGPPDPRYFIAGDDSIYGFLASLHARVIYINYVGMEKDIPVGKARSRFYYYFALRNRFISYEHFVKAGVPVDRKLFLFHIYRAAFQLLREIATKPEERTWRNVKTVFQAVSDGKNGRFGKPGWI